MRSQEKQQEQTCLQWSGTVSLHHGRPSCYPGRLEQNRTEQNRTELTNIQILLNKQGQGNQYQTPGVKFEGLTGWKKGKNGKKLEETGRNWETQEETRPQENIFLLKPVFYVKSFFLLWKPGFWWKLCFWRKHDFGKNMVFLLFLLPYFSYLFYLRQPEYRALQILGWIWSLAKYSVLKIVVNYVPHLCSYRFFVLIFLFVHYKYSNIE